MQQMDNLVKTTLTSGPMRAHYGISPQAERYAQQRMLQEPQPLSEWEKGGDIQESDAAVSGEVRFRKINVDGVDRPVENSEGNPIAQTEEGVRNFWKWFGDSKVVDAEGRPLVVYRGTTNNPGHSIGKDGSPIFFTDNIEAAANYANGMGFSTPIDPTIISVYLKSENPIIDDFEGEEDNDVVWNAEDIIEEASADGYFAMNTSDGQKYLNQYIVFSPTQIKSQPGTLAPLIRTIRIASAR